jgi:hypothetical protein
MKAENYTSVCWYCGCIYKSNKTTSHFCNPKHRGLFNKYGAAIPSIITGSDGVLFDSDKALEEIDYNTDNPDPEGWTYFYNLDSILYKYKYLGPLPQGDEILIVGSFAILKIETEYPQPLFGVKHITRLTRQERAGNLITSAGNTF